MHSRILEANRTRIYDTRQNRSARRIALSGHLAPKAIIDKCAIVPLLACVFALIVSPIFEYFTPLDRQVIYNGAARLEPRIFWPVMAAISVMLAVQNRSRLAKLTWPPHIICL